MSILDCAEIIKDFGGLRALAEVSFSVDTHEIFSIIGPNGSGKTTLFNVISGNLQPTSGSIRLNGVSIVGMKPHRICRGGIARTYQLVRPFANLPVVENVRMGLCFGNRRRIAYNATADRVTELLALSYLEKKAQWPAKDLTMAEKKRLEIARALATEPQIILLDEVMAGLNQHEVEEAIKLIKKIREMGVTVILIEHVMRAVASLSSRIMVLNQGRKIFEGSAEEVGKSEEVIRAYLGTKHSVR